MPIYEYQCQSCGQIREEWQKFSDAPLTTCGHCGGDLTKLISHSAFHLKGGGWYVSEYGRGNAGATTETKPAATTAAGDSPKKAEAAGDQASTKAEA